MTAKTLHGRLGCVWLDRTIFGSEMSLMGFTSVPCSWKGHLGSEDATMRRNKRALHQEKSRIANNRGERRGELPPF
jgi:hypothetical protein